MKTRFHSFDPYDIEVRDRQKLLTTAVAPRPIAFVSTVDKEGKVNLSPFSFFNVFSANPPVMIFSPARRGRDNTTKHTYENIKEVPEACISVVNFPMAEQMSLASAEFDKGVNEFEKSGFTSVDSDTIKPPRVGESPASFECKVEDVIELGEEGGAGNLVIAKVTRIHLNEAYLDKNGSLDPTKIDLIGRNGGNWYTRASGDALFEIEKPLQSLGIGVDRLPDHIKNSTVLTGNNLGRLGNLKAMPSEEEIKALKNTTDVSRLFSEFSGSSLTDKIHEAAHELIEQGNTDKALTLLLTLDHE
jgi:flavin reductase (DIM6/NTAB) family NADH-FMN oxidoreductase RutF